MKTHEEVKEYQRQYREKNKGNKKSRFNKFVKVEYKNPDDLYYNQKNKKT